MSEITKKRKRHRSDHASFPMKISRTVSVADGIVVNVMPSVAGAPQAIIGKTFSVS